MTDDNLSGNVPLSGSAYISGSKVIETSSAVGVMNASDIILANNLYTQIISVPQGVGITIVCPPESVVHWYQLKKEDSSNN